MKTLRKKRRKRFSILKQAKLQLKKSLEVHAQRNEWRGKKEKKKMKQASRTINY